MLSDLQNKMMECLDPADVLLVAPPFAQADEPLLAVHLLQACAAEKGIKVAVFYANLALAHLIGESNYRSLCQGPKLVGERFFAHVAYGKSLDSMFPPVPEPQKAFERGDILPLPASQTKDLAQRSTDFARAVASCIAARSYRVVGFSSSFEQTAGSISILNALKTMVPDVIVAIGGANCAGAMANGMSGLAKNADYIFSGESETTFPEFLQQVFRGERPADRIIKSKCAADLKSLPLPNFKEYFEQLRIFLPDSEVLPPEEIWLPYESSRGCWWGEKHQCTFCGLTGENIRHRTKPASLVLQQIRTMLDTYPTKNISPGDSIMPREYFKSLLPELEGIPGLNLFYEQKSNLTLENLKTLKRAGMNLIQPGIEALSTNLLKLMDKGVTARQHINLLRNARNVGVSLMWNLLCDFPGDQVEDYEQTLGFLPHIVHLHPPTMVQTMRLNRFSPYFESPAKYGIRNVRPRPAYREILPEDAVVEDIAYNFVGEYESAIRAHPALLDQMRELVHQWRTLWTAGGAAPTLSLTPIDGESYLLLDSRYNNKTARYEFLTKEHAMQLLAEVPVRSSNREDYEWALSRHLMLEVDGHFVPLALGSESLSEESALVVAETEHTLTEEDSGSGSLPPTL